MGALWINSVDGETALNLDHVVSLAVERVTQGQAASYRVVAITVLGSAVAVANGLPTAERARGWIADYLTTLAMSHTPGSAGE